MPPIGLFVSRDLFEFDLLFPHLFLFRLCVTIQGSAGFGDRRIEQVIICVQGAREGMVSPMVVFS